MTLFQPLSDLVAVDFRWPALVCAVLVGSSDSLRLALAPQIGLELGKDAEHVKESLAGGGRRIDGLFGREEMRAFRLYLQVAQRPGQPVDPGDDERLTGMNEVENCIELWTAFQGRTAFLLFADDLAAGGLERGDLRGEVLFGGGGAGVSDAGYANCSFWVCRRDALFINED
ncbi:hypothetical protein A9K72_31435 [Mesorhizobium loti]|nr:hypothetical protein A9174_31495 [Mesorhizobium loti NZP2037]OBP79913.1 hypothetical protein BAE41_29085 [Mesorhizobium loti]OBP96440.1 hypothetical protein BAE38_29735 [Mesorhizobium loti]OBQ73209.1 hypothetical protein A9K72_31435 [Mesorhizobium loti]